MDLKNYQNSAFAGELVPESLLRALIFEGDVSLFSLSSVRLHTNHGKIGQALDKAC